MAEYKYNAGLTIKVTVVHNCGQLGLWAAKKSFFISKKQAGWLLSAVWCNEMSGPSTTLPFLCQPTLPVGRPNPNQCPAYLGWGPSP